MTTTETTTTTPTVRVSSDDGDHRATVTVSRGEHSVSIEYWAPMDGGYVHEITDIRPGRLGTQVSDSLAHMGSMMHWSGRGRLSDRIRRAVRTKAGRYQMIARLKAVEEEAWWRTDEGRAVVAKVQAEMDTEYEAMFDGAD